MADKGQSKQQPKDNKYHRPRFVKAFMPKKKKPSSNSQSTPPPPGTATAIAWTEETELETNVDDNTPPSIEMTTDSERRLSDHSQRRNTSDRNNPIPVSYISFSVYSS